MYPRDKQANAGFAAGLYSYYSVLNRMFRLTLIARQGNPADISNFAKDFLVHMRPPGLSFSMSDFIWEEIKSISESPQRLCGYAPYIMHIIEKASNRKFLKDSKHESFKVPVPERMRLTSPGRYDEMMEEGEGQQQDQPVAASGQGQTFLTDLGNRPDRFGVDSSSQPRDKPPSPIRKLLNFFTSMCKSQRDVLVEQQRSRRERKQMKDTLKLLDNHDGFEPPRSPPSPETEEPEIPSVDSMVAQLGSEGYFQQYAHHYRYQVPNPPPPPMGPPTSGQSVVSQAYQSLFGNINGKMWFKFLFISIYHSFSSSKIQILS
jgi:hypothetical protein